MQPWQKSTCHWAHCLQHNWTRVDDTVVKELHRTFGNTMNRRWQEDSLLLFRKMELGQYQTIGDNLFFKQTGLKHDSHHVFFHVMQIWQVIARRQPSCRQYRGRRYFKFSVISALVNKNLLRLPLFKTSWKWQVTLALRRSESMRSDEGLTLETSASESLYGGQFTFLT